MALRLISSKVVPITLALAKKFRDMESLPNERELKAARSKGQARLLSEGKMFTMIWGQCRMKETGVIYRGNGNHTSHLLVACYQAHSKEGMDEISVRFCDGYLFCRTGGTEWVGKEPKDLPDIRGFKLEALVEEYECDEAEDFSTFFQRYDSKDSARQPRDLLNFYIGEFEELKKLDKRKVNYALAGVRRAATFDPSSFSLKDSKILVQPIGGTGVILRYKGIREATKWIVENVADKELYKSLAAANIMAEVWAEYGPEKGIEIVDEMSKQLKSCTEPITKWVNSLSASRNKPTMEKLLTMGRNSVKQAKEALAKEGKEINPQVIVEEQNEDDEEAA